MSVDAQVKSEMQKSDPFGFSLKDSSIKSVAYNNEDDLISGSIKRMIIGNTYNWMDSHDDVHMKGIFTKSIQENKNKSP